MRIDELAEKLDLLIEHGYTEDGTEWFLMTFEGEYVALEVVIKEGRLITRGPLAPLVTNVSLPFLQTYTDGEVYGCLQA